MRTQFVVVPAVLFCVFFSPTILDPQALDWLSYSDLAAHAIGAQALRADDWGFPLASTDLLYEPQGVPALFTDSNPLLTLFLKLLGPLMPLQAQSIGPWILFCLALNYYFAHRIVAELAFPGSSSRAGGTYLAVVFGAALLSLLPAVYDRLRHDTLMAHWVFLAAILFSLRADRRNVGWWPPLIVGLGLGVHPYFGIMAAPFLAAGILLVWWAEERPFGRAAVVGCLLWPAAICSVAGIIMIWPVLGLIDGAELRFSMVAVGGTPGLFTMDPFAWINPNMHGGAVASAFLPGLTTRPHQYEGFQYLGLGAICLIACAMLLAARRRYVPAVLMRREVLLLIPCSGLLLALAISPVVTVGGVTVLRVPVDAVPLIGAPIEKFFEVFRSGGRLAWPASFLLVTVALAAVLRLAPRRSTAIIGAAVALQLADLVPLAERTQAITRIAAAPAGSLHDPSAWNDVMASTSRVVVLPPKSVFHLFHSDLRLALAFYTSAMSARVPVSDVKRH
ncbi:MAG: DUF6311 domain-containing protein [Pseudomonadota bacterium]